MTYCPMVDNYDIAVEVVSKPPSDSISQRRTSLCVGLRRPILEIFSVWMLVPIFLIGAVGRLSPPFYPAGF